MTISEYLSKINKRYLTGISREHSYRGDLQTLLETLCPDVLVTNEPARVACGAPDYVLTRREIPIGYIEAKDIGDSDLLGKKANKEQFNRYKNSLDNLVFTDYLRFHFYKNGELVETIELAVIDGNTIVPQPEAFERFTALIKDFATYVGQTIRSSSKLSKMMAGKANMLAQVIAKAVESDEENDQNSTLKEQMNAFKQILIHDIKPKEFADIYAQTIAYGMFAARLHDETLEDFSRQEAANLIPKSNPFLRKLFQYISGYDIDDRIEWIVTALADIFRATDVRAILNNFGKATQSTDPIIHFYENFLAEYDPKLRKARGVWYTPEPVVQFIVRAVDDILKTEFNLPKGLADNSKTTIKLNTQNPDKRSKTGYRQIEKEVHRVQILDPATGTGTFLAEVINHIYSTRFKAMQGAWSSYVENDLIPRLNGFELLMASYSMAHLKLDMLLTETGFKPKRDQRFRVYLTNSLEESHPDTGTLFASWLSSEANEANHIKRDTPVMCVIGNPPYAVSSSNKGSWIEGLISDYKKDLNEKSYNSLSDDYVKFIRYGQYFIEKNSSGILAYITNNSFVSGVVHKQMRKSLIQTFDRIYIINLHGSSKTNETTPDGSIDENVFDIQQGVSINIFIKKEGDKGNKNADVKYYDLWGRRENKYDFLSKNSISSIEFKELKSSDPDYYFQEINEDLKRKFDAGISPTELFKKYSSGVQTEFDAVAIQEDVSHSEHILSLLNNLSVDELLLKLNLSIKNKNKLVKAKEDLAVNKPQIYPLLYRPFEIKSVIYTGKSNGIMGRPRQGLMQHMILGSNSSLVLKRARLLGKEKTYNHCFVSNSMIDKNFLADQSYCFPLYTYSQVPFTNEVQRTPNLAENITKEITERIGLSFIPEKEVSGNTFAPIDILDYIYAVLHSPSYREKYKEFLKIDFPRVPYPKDQETFWNLVELGGQLRKIHLLESPKVEDYITTYPEDGDNTITTTIGKKDWELYDKKNGFGRIRINDTQYFDRVPLVAWEFYIGGYQPAQKWLKDRKGRTLSFDDILHYQKIIVALTETDRLMKEIDEVGVEW